MQHADDAHERRLKLKPVLEEAYRFGFTVQSGFARAKAGSVACAAVLGLITTRIDEDLFGRDWRITAKGLRWLNEMRETKNADEA